MFTHGYERPTTTPRTCLTPVILGLGIDDVADGSLTTYQERLQVGMATGKLVNAGERG